MLISMLPRSKSSLTDGTNAQSKTDGDIFKTLLGKADSTPYSSYIPGEQVSVTIATRSTSDISLQRARVVRNKLFICQRYIITGSHVLSALLAGREIKFRALTTPTFPEPPLKEYVLSSPIHNVSVPPPSDALEYRPPLFVVRCNDPSNQMRPDCDASLSPDLFSKLFGPEVTLAGSPVVLVGCKNGHILYSSLSQVGIDQSSQGHPLNHSSTLPFLYSLGQPVVSINAVHFPERVIPELESSAFTLPVTSSAPSARNTLVFVGRLGKIVICTSGLSSQRSASFCEFHIPGPITSSLLVTDHALFYTTLSDVHKICVRENCVRTACESFPTNQFVLIPEVSLRLPETVARVDMGTMLLESLSVKELGSNKVFEVVCLTPRGRVYRHKINTRVCTGGSKVRIDSTVLADNLKQSLASFEVTSDRLNQMSTKISKQDVTLTELGQALSLVCDVASCTEGKDTTDQSDTNRCPFRCTFEPCYEEVGVCTHKPCIDVYLTYHDSQTTPLPSGWALVIQLYARHTKSDDHTPKQTLSGDSPKAITSKSVPLTKLQPGCPVSTRVCLQLEPRQTLNYTLHCFLHYSASHLVEKDRAGLHMTTPTTVTLPLCQKSFDAVDFLLPPKPTPRQLFTTSLMDPLRQIGSPGSHDTDELTFHTATVNIHRELGTGTNASRVLLCVLLRKQELMDLIVEDKITSHVELTSYSGCNVSITSSHSNHPDELTLSVQSSSTGMLAELGDCIQRRLIEIQRE